MSAPFFFMRRFGKVRRWGMFFLTYPNDMIYNTDMKNSNSKEQPGIKGHILSHQQFDIAAKDPFYVFPEDMLTARPLNINSGGYHERIIGLPNDY